MIGRCCRTSASANRGGRDARLSSAHRTFVSAPSDDYKQLNRAACLAESNEAPVRWSCRAPSAARPEYRCASNRRTTNPRDELLPICSEQPFVRFSPRMAETNVFDQTPVPQAPQQLRCLPLIGEPRELRDLTITRARRARYRTQHHARAVRKTHRQLDRLRRGVPVRLAAPSELLKRCALTDIGTDDEGHELWRKLHQRARLTFVHTSADHGHRAAYHKLTRQLRLGHELARRLRRTVVQQTGQHPEHTSRKTKTQRTIGQRRPTDQQPPPRWLVIKETEERHDPSSHSLKPRPLLTASRLIDCGSQTIEAHLKCRQHTILLTLEQFEEHLFTRTTTSDHRIS